VVLVRATDDSVDLDHASTTEEPNNQGWESNQKVRRRAPVITLFPPWLQFSTFILAIGLIAAGLFIPSFAGRSTAAASIPIIAGVGLVFYLLKAITFDSFDSYAEQIRQRVENDATTMHFNVQPGGRLTVEQTNQDPATVRASDSLEKQEAILREIYTQGLAQAKVSFRVSISFASVGAIFLLLGIALAIFNARNGGDQYASIVAGAAGVVVNLSSGVFFVQSNRARSNMGRQGVMLREESQEDRRLNAARELAGAINDEDLRNEVRADLARSLLSSPNISADVDTVEPGTQGPNPVP
jgi:hypothetical protein